MSDILVGIDWGASQATTVAVDVLSGDHRIFRHEGGLYPRTGYTVFIQRFVALLRDIYAVFPEEEIKTLNLSVGLAGFNWPSQEEGLSSLLQSALPATAAPLQLVNDTELGLFLDPRVDWGISLSCGTGVNCRGKLRDGTKARIIGCGRHFDEYGSGRDIVNKGIAAASKQWQKIGPATSITERLLRFCDEKDVANLIERLSTTEIKVPASFAEEIIHCAETGDEVAANIVDWIVEQQLRMLDIVGAQVSNTEKEIPVTLIGSLLQRSAFIQQQWNDLLAKNDHRYDTQFAMQEPVLGAILMTDKSRELHPTALSKLKTACKIVV